MSVTGNLGATTSGRRWPADMELGAGNVLLRLAEHGADPDMPRVTFDTDVDGIPAWTPLSLADPDHTGWPPGRTGSPATGHRPARPGRGLCDVRPDVFLNFLALTWLGAIPALMNGNMPIEIAAEFIRRLRGVGVIIDADHAELAAHDLGRADPRRRGGDRHRRSRRGAAALPAPSRGPGRHHPLVRHHPDAGRGRALAPRACSPRSGRSG